MTTTTERQTIYLESLDTDTLVPIAVDALHALNRRAKKLRDKRKSVRGYGRFRGRDAAIEAAEAQAAEIYAAKTALLEACCIAGIATVEEVTTERDYFGPVTCSDCGHEWVGLAGSDCRWHYGTCNGCGMPDDGSDDVIEEAAGLVYLGPYSFHQPGEHYTDAMQDAAIITSHDADISQPAREIPPVAVGRWKTLTIAAQLRAAKLATERLAGVTVRDELVDGLRELALALLDAPHKDAPTVNSETVEPCEECGYLPPSRKACPRCGSADFGGGDLWDGCYDCRRLGPDKGGNGCLKCGSWEAPVRQQSSISLW